jgi:diadenosine tetraphosphate (Ap4A) HIT family hydrolase
MSATPFTNPDPDDEVLSNALCYARWDNYPVSQGHLLGVPYREFANYFDATPDEKAALWALVDEAKRYIDELHRSDGYNIGINVGEVAGQTVAHMHIHVIPRYRNDVPDPRGGVRGVISKKQKY